MAPRFYVGQPVICVDDRLKPHVVARFPGLEWPRAGVRYVIRRNIYGGRAGWFVLVNSIRNRKILWPGTHRFAEAGFHEDRFEPATDISEFEKTRAAISEWGKSSEWDRKVTRRVRKKERA